jgi:hypothetical protein
VGWWQFARSDLHFQNYWLDPAGVLNYALGLEFPRYPTIQDYLRDRGENLVAGMSLARRGVPFSNYGRAYLEGASAVSDHTYLNQADATMRYFLDVHTRIARSRSERTPAFSNLLLAAADEFSHLEGVTTSDSSREHCFTDRDEDTDLTIFRLLDEDKEKDNGGHLEQLEHRYFSRVDHARLSGKHRRLCIEVPSIRVFSAASNAAKSSIGAPSRRSVHPHYVLAMMLIDMELGYLINRFRSIRFNSRGERYFEPARDLPAYMKGDTFEDSLFERTLFILFGDHGMVDTERMMVPPDPNGNPHRHRESLSTSFIGYLNRALHLESATDVSDLAADAQLGIDYQAMPRRLSQPYRYPSWQSKDIRRQTREAVAWAQDFFEELHLALRSNLHKRYWWLFFLRSLLIDPRLDSTLDSVSEPAVDMLAGLYLRGEPSYLRAEARARRDFFDRHVRLVYGGGARNIAELFFPSCEETDQGRCGWAERPSYSQILRYRGGDDSATTVMDALGANPGVGLIFIREENDQIAPSAPLPATMHIRVRDRFSNTGRITVWRDQKTRQLVFRYQVDRSSRVDPLGHGELGQGEGTVGTYSEWNDRSAAAASRHYYHNAVAGVGSYLYSNNPAIGDVLVFHSQGWNFGSNGGGHGGIHRGEKRTLMLVSGRGVQPGRPLRARSRYRTLPDGTVVEYDRGLHYPTLLDIVPTALTWLGRPADALETFARGGFEPYLLEWNRAQRDDILAQLGGADAVERALGEAGFNDFRIGQFRRRLKRLLEFVALAGREESLDLPDYRHFRTDGNQLVLQ